MDLKYHLCFHLSHSQDLVNFKHGEFDQVSGTSLKGCINGQSFCGAADDCVAAEDFRNVPLSSNHGHRPPLLASRCDAVINKVEYFRITDEIGLYKVEGLFDLNSQFLGEAVGLLSVDDAEVN